MWNDIWDIIYPVLMNGVTLILAGVISIIVAYGVKFIRAKLGDIKFNKAVIVGELVIKIVTQFFKENPAIEITAELIIGKFKEEILKVIPLTDDEVNFIFNALKSAIIDALGLNPTALAITQTVSLKSKKKKRLFS